MPCLAQESISSLIRETYSHCHVPCVRIPAAGWSSGYDTDDDSFLDDALDSKQVILNEMRNRQMKKRSRCSVDSPTPSSPFVWSSFTPLDPRSVLEKVPIPKKCVMEEQEIKKEKGKDCGDADDESEAFFSVKSFFSRSTSRGATVASSLAMDLAPPLQSPATWEGFRDCEGWPFGLCRPPPSRRCPARRPTRGSGATGAEAEAEATSPRARLVLTVTKSPVVAKRVDTIVNLVVQEMI